MVRRFCCADVTGRCLHIRAHRCRAHMIDKNKRPNHPLSLERKQAANHKVADIPRALFDYKIDVRHGNILLLCSGPGIHFLFNDGQRHTTVLQKLIVKSGYAEFCAQLFFILITQFADL